MLGHSFKFKIDGKRLIPIHLVKYLGVLIEEHMSWNEQIYQIKLKLNRAIGILGKLRSHATLNTLRIAYYSLFNLICNMAYNYGASKIKKSKK